MSEPTIEFAAYCYQGRLCLLGIAKTRFGPVPLGAFAKIEGESSEGPIDLDENLPEHIQVAAKAAQADMLSKLDFETLKTYTEGMVERARAREQNARAQIEEVRKAAREGGERAKLVMSLIENYISTHPYDARIAGELSEGPGRKVGKTQLLCAILLRALNTRDPYSYTMAISTYLPDVEHNSATVVALANGPPLLKSKIVEIADSFGSEEESETFLMGATRPVPRIVVLRLPSRARKVLAAGWCVGMARKIQGARYENVPLSVLSPAVAWELGE